ncbi:beta-N-acetylglucosaminidase domain-containing protein [Pseudohaliea rubra]|uniref:Hyaluronidase n=1 Tax=Pseudohaliea rubra DSM 19751 TaxID=1265313 RepID=A0A095XVA4_9GAMM|nr:beta-N-acetylglucosaminidase domain-containing protein [Pseudohaliea rubra]KGE03576.1 Hyaluronidase [Pseudohaliea rubra DSM 19751]
MTANVIATSRLTGAIEGFYGRPWSAAERWQLVTDVGDLGLDAYLYAPKADAHLRRRWSLPWPAAETAALERLAGHARSSGVMLGLGLSPFKLYEDYGPSARRKLQVRVRQLDDLGAALLAILFDDMPGDTLDLAARQGEIVADVAAWSRAERLLVCPTYYSDDPVLDRVFGPRPDAYREALGAALPPGAGIFWTGPEVCAPAISGADLAAASSAFRRPLTLWDNWPVNDGAKRSLHLYLGPPPQRGGALGAHCAGHLCNAMNQPALSLPALAGLAELHGRIASAAQWLEERLGPSVAAALAEDAPLFEARPRDQLDRGERRRLRERYAALPGSAPRELLAWLDGAWAFDPDCLTD